jgi:hypothetical protein
MNGPTRLALQSFQSHPLFQFALALLLSKWNFSARFYNWSQQVLHPLLTLFFTELGRQPSPSKQPAYFSHHFAVLYLLCFGILELFECRGVTNESGLGVGGGGVT